MKAQTTPRKLTGQQNISQRPSTSSSIRVKKTNDSKNNINSSRKRPKTPQAKSMLKDSTCIELRKKLEDDPDFSEIETDQLIKLISHLREYSQYCAINEKYKRALRAQELGEMSKKELSTRTTKIKQTKDIVDQQNESRSRFEQRWRDNFNNYQNETLEKRDELRKKQAHETRLFERTWAHEMPHKYRKPSQRLLELKQIEKSLAISGEIERANYIHSQVVVQTQKEIDIAQANLIHDYQVARTKHLQKQMQDLNRFEESRESGRQLLEAEYKAEQMRMKNRDFVVQTHIKNSILRAKATETPPTRSAGVPKNRDATIGALLPKLIAPNDPMLLKHERIRRKQVYEKQKEYAKRYDQQMDSRSYMYSPVETNQESEYPKSEHNHAVEEQVNDDYRQQIHQSISSKGRLDKDGRGTTSPEHPNNETRKTIVQSKIEQNQQTVKRKTNLEPNQKEENIINKDQESNQNQTEKDQRPKIENNPEQQNIQTDSDVTKPSHKRRSISKIKEKDDDEYSSYSYYSDDDITANQLTNKSMTDAKNDDILKQANSEMTKDEGSNKNETDEKLGSILGNITENLATNDEIKNSQDTPNEHPFITNPESMKNREKSNIVDSQEKNQKDEKSNENVKENSNDETRKKEENSEQTKELNENKESSSDENQNNTSENKSSKELKEYNALDKKLKESSRESKKWKNSDDQKLQETSNKSEEKTNLDNEKLKESSSESEKQEKSNSLKSHESSNKSEKHTNSNNETPKESSSESEKQEKSNSIKSQESSISDKQKNSDDQKSQENTKEEPDKND